MISHHHWPPVLDMVIRCYIKPGCSCPNWSTRSASSRCVTSVEAGVGLLVACWLHGLLVACWLLGPVVFLNGQLDRVGVGYWMAIGQLNGSCDFLGASTGVSIVDVPINQGWSSFFSAWSTAQMYQPPKLVGFPTWYKPFTWESWPLWDGKPTHQPTWWFAQQVPLPRVGGTRLLRLWRRVGMGRLLRPMAFMALATFETEMQLRWWHQHQLIINWSSINHPSYRGVFEHLEFRFIV